MRIFGGTTGLQQPLEIGLNQGFREVLKEIQEEQDMAAWRDGKKVANPTRMDILDRVCKGYFWSVKTKASLGCWKKAGITNSLAGDEDAIWMKHGMSDWRKKHQEATPERVSAPTLLAMVEGQPALHYPEEPSSDEDTDDE